MILVVCPALLIFAEANASDSLNGERVFQVFAMAVGANVVLADRSESLEVSVREIGVTTLAVLDGGSGFTGIVGLGDEGLAATNATGVLDDGVPGAQTSCVVEELHISTTIMYISKG